MEYIFGYDGFNQKLHAGLETGVYLNFGKEKVKFRIKQKYKQKQETIGQDRGEEEKFNNELEDSYKEYILKEMDIIVIPSGTQY